MKAASVVQDNSNEVRDGLTATGYIADSIAITTVYLAARLRKPLLLEGPAGSGKTQVAIAVAEAANTVGCSEVTKTSRQPGSHAC